MSRNDELESLIESKAGKDPGFALAYALLKLTDAVYFTAAKIDHHSIENSAALRDVAASIGRISLVCNAQDGDG